MHLTADQWLWLQCQLLLDDGIDACPACEGLGSGPYCSGCGTRMHPVLYTCTHCHLSGAGPYCSGCGASLTETVSDAVARGAFDWDAWAKSLTPFLGGLSPQEEMLLAQDMGRNGV